MHFRLDSPVENAVLALLNACGNKSKTEELSKLGTSNDFNLHESKIQMVHSYQPRIVRLSIYKFIL